jgi:adenosine deaminase
LLKYLHDKEIVIETLPTSNVIIGHHHDYGTYHLYNWYRWKKEGKPLPPIVVGTDDTGIFATNIYNEYCNIFCQMVYGKGMNADEATAFIRELDRNARLYAFEGSKR